VLAELETLSQEVGVSCDRCHRTVTFSVDGAATALRRMQSTSRGACAAPIAAAGP
jgi:hypothetical protein